MSEDYKTLPPDTGIVATINGSRVGIHYDIACDNPLVLLIGKHVTIAWDNYERAEREKWGDLYLVNCVGLVGNECWVQASERVTNETSNAIQEVHKAPVWFRLAEVHHFEEEEKEEDEISLPRPPTRTPLSVHKKNLVEFLREKGPTTRKDIALETNIPPGSLSELLSSEEFLQFQHGLWTLKSPGEWE